MVSYFENIPSLHRALILAGGIVLFWLIESAVPLFKFKYHKWQHAIINLFFTATTILVNFSLAFSLLWSAEKAVSMEFGILPIIQKHIPFWVYTLIGLMLLDLIGAYAAHWAEHRVRWMWKFHLIHHTDTWVDTTTANRHHPGESVIRFVFTLIAVWIVGSPMWMVFLYQSLSVVFSQFNHANMPLPQKWDKALSYFIVSPDMHKVHHHYKLPFTDSNYGNIFSIWDRLFGTYRLLERNKIVYGIDTHTAPHEHNNLKMLLKIPFLPYRKPTEETT